VSCDTEEAWGTEASPIGLAGVGKIGTEVARRLSSNGCKVVLYNRTRRKADALASEIGASVVDSPGELAASCGLVLSILSEWSAVQGVYHGPQGFLANSTKNSVFVELTTLGPTLMKQLAGWVSEAGASLVDASITGRPVDIANGHGLLMAGGEDEHITRLESLLSPIGAFRHTGVVGSGSAMKLVVNMMLFTTLESIAEALNLAEKSGVERDVAYDLLGLSPVSSKILQYRRDEILFPGAAPVQATLSTAAKDLELIVSLAKDAGAYIPQAMKVRDVFAAAEDAGFGPRDVTSIAEFMRRDSARGLVEGD